VTGPSLGAFDERAAPFWHAALDSLPDSLAVLDHHGEAELDDPTPADAHDPAAAERARAEAMLARADAMDARAADATRRASDARSRAQAAIQRHRTSR